MCPASVNSIPTRLLKQRYALQETPKTGFCRREVPVQEFVGRQRAQRKAFPLKFQTCPAKVRQTPGRSKKGFSLVEAVLAVAIIAVGVTAVLGLLPSLARQSTDSADTQTALRLGDAIETELAGRAAGAFDGFAASIPIMSADPDQGLRFVAAKDGTNLRLLNPGETPTRDQYFLLAVRRFPTAPLAYGPASAWLAANVLVAWPYRVLTPAGLTAESAPGARQTVNFNIALCR